MNYFYPLFLMLLLGSCDAFVSIPYSVRNRSSETLRLYVPATSWSARRISNTDTILEIAPHSTVSVGSSMLYVTGPVGAARNVYRRQPGPCGLKVLRGDSALLLPCTAREWKFKRKGSQLVLNNEKR